MASEARDKANINGERVKRIGAGLSNPHITLVNRSTWGRRLKNSSDGGGWNSWKRRGGEESRRSLSPSLTLSVQCEYS